VTGVPGPLDPLVESFEKAVKPLRGYRKRPITANTVDFRAGENRVVIPREAMRAVLSLFPILLLVFFRPGSSVVIGLRFGLA